MPSDQLTIPDPPPSEIEPFVRNNPQKRDLRRMAAEWIRENPEIYRMIADLAVRWEEMGERFGVKALFEHLRRTRRDLPRQEGEFKLNNDLTAYIGRQLREDFPQLRRVLRVRKTFH